MKTVKFQGIEYQVPDWANWIVQDSNGCIKVFMFEPLNRDLFWVGDGEISVVVRPGAPMVKEQIK